MPCRAWIYFVLSGDFTELRWFAPLEIVETRTGEQGHTNSRLQSCKSSFPLKFFFFFFFLSFPPPAQTPRSSSLQTHSHHGEAAGGQTSAFHAEYARRSRGYTPSRSRGLLGFLCAELRPNVRGSFLWILRSRDGVFHPGRGASSGRSDEEAVLSGAGSLHHAGKRGGGVGGGRG